MGSGEEAGGAGKQGTWGTRGIIEQVSSLSPFSILYAQCPMPNA
ncbi:hypothetical protein [Nostoc foliaceum]|nr:hypothetical protein [Nostoc foliaceum]